MGWRGRRAARTRPVLEYATSRTIPAGATMNRLPTNRMPRRRPDATARSRQVPPRPRPAYRRRSHRSASRAAQDAAHAVDAAARRRGRGAQEQARVGRRVRVPADDGAEQQLAHVLDAAVDVAADVVGVVRLHRARAVHGPGQDEVPEAGRDTARPAPRSPSVASTGPAVGDVAVGPGDVLARRARATGRRWSAGRAARTAARQPGRGGRRPRPRRPRRIVPPRWTVPARAVCASRQGIGPSSAQSSL